jgi:hypothetical protein
MAALLLKDPSQRLLLLITLSISIFNAESFSYSTTLHLNINSPLTGIFPKQYTPVIKFSTMDQRRSNTERNLVTENDDNVTDSSNLSTLYRGVSSMYFGQVLLALKKSGLTLGCLNIIGGPLMATGIALILGSAAEKQLLGSDTFKRLNGLMFLYATLALMLVAIVPQLYSPFGMLWFFSGSSTLFVATKGYFSGLKADDNKSFLPETSRLLNAASRTSLALPPKQTSFGNFFILLTIGLKKAAICWGIFQVLLSSGSVRSQIAVRLSQLIKLTILGGSTVTAMSIDDDSKAQELVLVPLNMLSFYVLTTMACKYQYTLWEKSGCS